MPLYKVSIRQVQTLGFDVLLQKEKENKKKTDRSKTLNRTDAANIDMPFIIGHPEREKNLFSLAAIVTARPGKLDKHLGTDIDLGLHPNAPVLTVENTPDNR